MSLKENRGNSVSIVSTSLLGQGTAEHAFPSSHALINLPLTISCALLQNVLYIKPEPEEARIAPLAQSRSWQAEQKPVVKPEPVDATRLVSFPTLSSHRRRVLTR